MNTTPEQRAALRQRADWISEHTTTGEARMLVPVAEVLALLEKLDAAEAALARVTAAAHQWTHQWQPAHMTPETFDQGVGAFAQDVLTEIAGDPAPAVLDFGTTTDAELALSQGLLRNPDNGELR